MKCKGTSALLSFIIHIYRIQSVINETYDYSAKPIVGFLLSQGASFEQLAHLYRIHIMYIHINICIHVLIYIYKCAYDYIEWLKYYPAYTAGEKRARAYTFPLPPAHRPSPLTYMHEILPQKQCTRAFLFFFLYLSFSLSLSLSLRLRKQHLPLL